MKKQMRGQRSEVRSRIFGVMIVLVAVATICGLPRNVTADPPSTEAVVSLPDGLHIGSKTTDRVGFYDGTPLKQQANTVTPRGVLQALHLMGQGGTDPYQLTASNPIKQVTVSVSSADLLALYSAPKLLIAAPSAGHSIAISKVNFAITRTATAYVTGGGAAIIQYDSTVHGAGTQACDSTIAATVITGAAGLSNTIRNGAVISDSGGIDGKGIYLSAATGDFTAGTGTAVVTVWYYVN